MDKNSTILFNWRTTIIYKNNMTFKHGSVNHTINNTIANNKCTCWIVKTLFVHIKQVVKNCIHQWERIVLKAVGASDLHVHWPGRADLSACSHGCDDARSKCCPLPPRSLLLQPAGACAPPQQTDEHKSDTPAGVYRKRWKEKIN